MLLRITSEDESQIIPLGGARAVRAWGGLWARETHPAAARHPSEGGDFQKEPSINFRTQGNNDSNEASRPLGKVRVR
jgi:hypothetical protein